MRAMYFIAIFATSKDPRVFSQDAEFDLNSIATIVHNCATNNALDDKSLFIGALFSTNKNSLIEVGDSDRRPSQYSAS